MLCFIFVFSFYRGADSDSDDDGKEDPSDRSDDEDVSQQETTDKTRTTSQTAEDIPKSQEQQEEIEWTDADVHKLEKAARTGFKWMKPVFKDVLA